MGSSISKQDDHDRPFWSDCGGGDHPDNRAVDRFAGAMTSKLAAARRKGRGGWDRKDECSAEDLSRLLREHVEKGDPVDVANFCMMLHQRGERIAAASLPNQESEDGR